MAERRKVPVLIFGGGDDARRLSALKKAADAEKKQADELVKSGRRVTAPVGTEARDAFDAAAQEASERADHVWVQDIGAKFRTLVRSHPPRRERLMVDGLENDVIVDDDVQFDVNTETFPQALLLYRDERGRRTIADPLPAEAQSSLEDYLDDLPAGEYDKLWMAAYFVNAETAADPKALTFSGGTTTPSETSG